MALIDCEECGKEVSDKATACIHCGAPIEKEEEYAPPSSDKYKTKFKPEKPKKKGSLGKTIFVIIAVFILTIWYAESEKNKPEEEMLQVGVCENLIKSQLKFPSSFESKDFLGVPSIMETKDGLILEIKFEAKNALGNVLPYFGQCLQTDKEVKFLGMKNR